MQKAAFLASVVLAAACHHNEPARQAPLAPVADQPAAPTPPVDPQAAPGNSAQVTLSPAGQPPVALTVEVQSTEPQRERGLMFRRELAELAGMIFVFPAPSHQVFWMHNTYLALDMIFIDSQGSVLGVVENATPMTDDPREVPGNSLYVLEVRAGFAARHHIAAGTRVSMVNVGPATE